MSKNGQCVNYQLSVSKRSYVRCDLREWISCVAGEWRDVYSYISLFTAVKLATVLRFQLFHCFLQHFRSERYTICIFRRFKSTLLSVLILCVHSYSHEWESTHTNHAGYMWVAGYKSLIGTVCLHRVCWAEALQWEACWMAVCSSGICMCIGSVYSAGPIGWSVLCCGMCRTTISISSEVIWCCLPFVCRRCHSDWWVRFVHKKWIASC